jgi:broad specificity phosphatase PhoE
MTRLTILSLLASLPLVLSSPTQSSYIKYSTVPGYFLQDLNATNATTFSYTATNFGLINQSYPTDPSNAASLTQWQRFSVLISSLNSHAAPNIEYKLLFLGRHGEGWHNAAETYYGTPAWNCYWSLLDGNATATWADPDLTSNGIAQALIAHNFWLSMIATQKIQVPQSYYTSPLYRCLTTANLTFTGLPLPRQYPFIATVKSKLREDVSEHTCDRRSNRTYIHASFPKYRFEPGFTEYDTLWTGITAEPSSAQDARSKELLDDIFSSDCDTYLSFTSHSGEIGSLLRVLGHRVFSLRTGAVIPVLVKAETVAVPTTTTAAASWTPSPHCTVPPVTSISGGPSGGCVCPNGATPVTTLLGGYATGA